MPRFRRGFLSGGEKVRSALESPVDSEIKKSIIKGLHIEIIKKMAEEKILESQRIQDEALKILQKEQDALKKLSKLAKKRANLILRANRELDEAMLKLKKKIQLLINTINFHLQNVTILTREYISPLSIRIEDGIKCIRDEMRQDFRTILDNKSINRAFYEISQEIKFDLKNHSHNPNQGIDFLKLDKSARNNK